MMTQVPVTGCAASLPAPRLRAAARYVLRPCCAQGRRRAWSTRSRDSDWRAWPQASSRPGLSTRMFAVEGLQEGKVSYLCDLKATFEFEADPLKLPKAIGLSLVDKNGEETEVQEIKLAAQKSWEPTVMEVCTFSVPRGYEPGLIKVENKDNEGNSFRLIAVMLEGKPAADLTVPCFSWIEPGQGSRWFACGLPTLRNDTPKALLTYREDELKVLQGENDGTRAAPDRIYDYDTYNDLGTKEFERPVMGGRQEAPYPRRYRTGRTTDSKGKEEPTSLLEFFYVPKDDDFLPEKQQENGGDSVQIAQQLKKIVELVSEAQAPLQSKKFSSMEDIEDKMYEELGFKTPDVYLEREQLWKKDLFFSDFEFGRQRIAGVHPCTIKAVENLSDLAPVADDAVDVLLLEGKTLSQRLKEGSRIFYVDYRTELLSMKTENQELVLTELNASENGKYVYAPMCVLYRTNDGILLPIAIDLVEPGTDGKVCKRNTENGKDKETVWTGDEHIHRLYTPLDSPTEWAMAKGHFLAADSCVHQIYSHFTRCHANEEVYTLATRRQLSQMHPIHRLLMPHFKDTLRINANARKALIAAKKPIEESFATDQYSMNIGVTFYANHFRFKTEGFPRDLVKRGMAYIDPEKKDEDDVKLVLEDYPYAADGMLVWKAMKNWVTKYVSHYYLCDKAVDTDIELQNWWTEIMHKGHPDIVDFNYASEDEMWPSLITKADLVYILVTIMWHASAFHAAINFGQYELTAYMPSQPSGASLPMPERGNHPEHTRIDSEFLSRMASIYSSARAASVVAVLSKHYSDEQYIGNEIKHYFLDTEIRRARDEFKNELEAAAKIIKTSNKENSSRGGSRLGIDYNLLTPYVLPHPESGGGIPNSVSI